MSQQNTVGGKDTLVNQLLVIKLAFLGESTVGKTSIVHKFVNYEFQENREQTINGAFLTQKCRLGDKIIRFEIWDIVDRKSYHTLIYRNAHVVVVVYDVTNVDSFDKAKSLIRELKSQVDPKVVIFLVGNKIDLSERQVPTEEVKDYALEFGLLFYETSAKTDDGIRTIFTKIAEKFVSDDSFPAEENVD
ncbi:hypothetical protein RclHR1_17330004 [Rhizophagus clarus]|uniref:Ras-domain-containing protein n=1 Tax=Rhizophagus clarus TaxID=94130 RepID=A0A2Z6QLA0_9GLOM|nr:hypothetical protein RclHR1_17330004 [Rhizophagus clarus]GES75931.1 ras-domain-containing protein [Rhizophagus clarus]